MVLFIVTENGKNK